MTSGFGRVMVARKKRSIALAAESTALVVQVFSPPRGEDPDAPALDLQTFRRSRGLTHTLFRFPGKFHPALVTHLVALHPKADLISDPMSGSGTVAVEAAAVGKRGLFSDIDPLSCLITRAKSHPVSPDWLDRTVEEIRSNAGRFAKRGASEEEAKEWIMALEASTSFRAPPNIFHWFQNYVTINLCKILIAVHDLSLSGEESDAILAVFASVIRRVSRADPNTTSGLEVTKPRSLELSRGLRFDVVGEFVDRARLLSKGYRKMLALPKLGETMVVERDVKDWGKLCSELNEWPDLIVTSPCYLSAIEYWRRHKLEYCLLGLVPPDELPDMRRKFLGMGIGEPDIDSLPPFVRELHSQLSDMGRKSEAKVLGRYFVDSATWLKEVASVIGRSDGVAYVVVGSNTTHGLSLDTPKALLNIAKDVGLSASVFKRYGIKNSYMQYSTRTERIGTESVLKLTK